MPRLTCVMLGLAVVGLWAASAAPAADAPPAVSLEKLAAAIQRAAPDTAPAKPAAPRKVLVYGRERTHAESVPPCFLAVEILGKKTGAFTTVKSGDPSAFLPENLKQFDAVVMNNTHERDPMLPENFAELGPDEQAAAQKRSEMLKRSLLDFVAGGKGIVGIHGATAAVRWPEYSEMMGGTYGGHITDTVWVRAEDPDDPVCANLKGKEFEVRDEIYAFKEPYSRDKVRVLLSIDLSKSPEPGKRPDKDYPVSWIRTYGKGRVFYGSLGHLGEVYAQPAVLAHYLAGIQYALGDLKADATPRPLGR